MYATAYILIQKVSLNSKLTDIINKLNAIYDKVTTITPNINYNKNIRHYSILINLNNHTIDTFNKLKHFHIDAIDHLDYSKCYMLYQKFNKTNISNIFIPQPASFVTFDLDDTIVDKNNQLMLKIKQLEIIKKFFNYCILWSHGTPSHVDSLLTTHKLHHYFDLIIYRDQLTEQPDDAKYMTYVFKALNKKYNITNITVSCLIDDLHDNCALDYSLYFWVPKTEGKYSLIPFYDKCIKKIRARLFNC